MKRETQTPGPVVEIPSFSPKLPEIYQVEVTNDCMFNCEFCVRKQMPRPITYMEKNLAQLIAENYLGGSYFVEFQMAGEPLLHPDLGEIISYFKGKVLTGLSTNGYLIHKQLPALMQLDYLTISIDSLTDYNKVRKGGDFYKLIDNLNLFFKLKGNKERPYVDLQIIEFPGWENELKTLTHLCKQNEWDASVRTVVDCFLTYDGYHYQEQNNEVCLNPFMSVSIQADGDVTACCFSFGKDIVLGNIAVESLEQIWEGREAAKLRFEHRSGQHRPICQKCYMRSPVMLHWKIYQENIARKIRGNK